MLVNMELHKKLKEALESDGFFITITGIDRKKGRLNHYHITQGFPKDDIMPTLEHYAQKMHSEVLSEETGS